MQQTVSRWPLAAALMLPLFGMAACSSQDTKPAAAPPPPAPPSLYDRLGGQPAITAVVDDFVANIAADRRVSGRFRHTNIAHLKSELADQICAGSGGPCTYTGKTMADAHSGMRISDAEFNAVVQDLRKSLVKNNVGAQEQSDLIAVLGPMRDDIVTKGAPPPPTTMMPATMKPTATKPTGKKPVATKPQAKKPTAAKPAAKPAPATATPAKAPAKKPAPKKPATTTTTTPPNPTTPPATTPSAPAKTQ